MDFLVFKAISSPLLLLLASLALRHWGATMGGFLVGLPLTSGPISVFFAIEYGWEFALCAISGSLAAVAGQAAFAVMYCALVSKGWVVAILGASTAFVTVAATLQWSGISHTALCAVAMLTLALSLRLIPARLEERRHLAPLWWDLPLRMIIMALLVIGVTITAGRIGAGLAGILASFPFMTVVLGSFAHITCGNESARLIMRGLCAGLFGSIAFFYVISVTLMNVSNIIAYGEATLCALTVEIIALRLIRASA